ncbi:MAG: toll/interleukin-1 receptor domain-containing protein [Azoarcus sp.]|nr:toll/interleukin-1 receptor domain-containing protein [Azoarcus sp.]
MQGIFVSYRRQDSQSAAGRLSDHLKEHMLGVPIFRDVETIEPGMDFVEAIERALESCAVLVAVIGPRWVSVTDDAGRRRLDNTNDYTRLEIATALRRNDVRVIPVLVDGATMPAAEDLPADLEGLARRNAIELSDKRWEYDVSQLVVTLRKVLNVVEPTPAPSPTPAPPLASGSDTSPKASFGGNKKWWAAAAVLVLVVIGAVIEEEGSTYTPMDLPQDAPGVSDQQVPPGSPPPGATSSPAGTNVLPALAGLWRDPAGGQYEIAQQGNQIVIQGVGPDGYVSGSAMLQGQRGEGAYTLNGYPLQSSLQVSGDGMRIDVGILDPATGQRDSAVLLRVR